MKGGVKMKTTNNQRGNVLFLILIAVALFAALSYAVTQSSRSGGDASRETNILNAAQLTQYPTSIRTAVLRLVIDGFQDTNILYNVPSGGFTAASEPYEVFATIGGGAIYQRAPVEVMQVGGANPTGVWSINMDFEVGELGRTAAGNTGNELIAFLPGITTSVCTRINLEANIIASPADSNPAFGSDVTGTADGDVGKNITLLTQYGTTNVSVPSALDGFPFGCFTTGSGDGVNVLYTVILER
jgi:hypothetical protein